MTLPFRTPSRALVFAIAVAAGSGLVQGPAVAAASGPFLAHQALYDLSLVKSRGSNSVSDARGRILYNFSGNSCEGYTSEFRQVSELDSGEGKVTLSDLRSTSWEDASGKSYRFKIDTRMNDSESSPVDGIAERVGDHITVKLTPAGQEDVQYRRQDRVPDRADPAHHRCRPRRQVGARADRL
ncbi:hypothetical protein ACVIM8_004799 [Bradyrhizobium sp. USDA 4529]